MRSPKVGPSSGETVSDAAAGRLAVTSLASAAERKRAVGRSALPRERGVERDHDVTGVARGSPLCGRRGEVCFEPRGDGEGDVIVPAGRGYLDGEREAVRGSLPAGTLTAGQPVRLHGRVKT